MSMAWEPDRRSNSFFSPPAHLCAVTYMTEISLIVTLNNHSLTHSLYMPCYGNNDDGIMPFTKKLCAGFKNIKNKNLSQTKQLSQKGNQ